MPFDTILSQGFANRSTLMKMFQNPFSFLLNKSSSDKEDTLKDIKSSSVLKFVFLWKEELKSLCSKQDYCFWENMTKY